MEIRLPGERDIQRLEPFRRIEQRHWRLGPWARCPVDLSSELFGAGELQVIDGVSLDLCEQAERGVVRTGLQRWRRRRPTRALPRRAGSTVRATEC